MGAVKNWGIESGYFDQSFNAEWDEWNRQQFEEWEFDMARAIIINSDGEEFPIELEAEPIEPPDYWYPDFPGQLSPSQIEAQREWDAYCAEGKNLCVECKEPTSSPEGLCYQCQCEMHAIGRFDMDGVGWI